MLAVSKPTARGAPRHVLSGRRRGSRCIVQTGVDHLGHRPSSRVVTARRSAPICRASGCRASAVAARPDPLDEYRAYVVARFADDPHLWASALFDEVVALGYPSSYVSFARQIRLAGLRPHCEACSGVKGRETIEIDHPAGEEIQWDWFERRKAPWGATAYVLLGTLSHSGRTRGVLAESMDQAHLIEAMDAVMRRLGGTARKWRTDRLATVIVPGTADVQASFAPVAKHYGAIVTPCPPRRGNRKGAVECGVKFCCGRWWRTMTATTPGEAQVSLDRFWSTHRRRPAAAAGALPRPRRAGRRGGPADVADRRRAGRGRRADGPAGGSLPGHHRGDAGPSTTRPAWPFGATATRWPRGWPGPRSPSGTAWAPGASRSSRPSGAAARLPPPGPAPGAGAMVRTEAHRAAP